MTNTYRIIYAAARDSWNVYRVLQVVLGTGAQSEMLDFRHSFVTEAEAIAYVAAL